MTVSLQVPFTQWSGSLLSSLREVLHDQLPVHVVRVRRVRNLSPLLRLRHRPGRLDLHEHQAVRAQLDAHRRVLQPRDAYHRLRSLRGVPDELMLHHLALEDPRRVWPVVLRRDWGAHHRALVPFGAEPARLDDRRLDVPLWEELSGKGLG